MIWTAALYFTVSPKPASSEPACGSGAVAQAARAIMPAEAARSLKDMAILLFETDRLGRGAAARRWRRDNDRRGSRCGRNADRSGAGRDAGVGAAEQEQVGLVRRAGP